MATWYPTKPRARGVGAWAAEAEHEHTQQKVRNFHEFRYAAKSWDRERRVIVKAERLEQGPNVRFVLTNLDAPPAAIYDERYTPRGDMENRIKEQQLMLFATRASCHAFEANQFRLLLSAAAYVLIQHLSSAYPLQALFRRLTARLIARRRVEPALHLPGFAAAFRAATADIAGEVIAAVVAVAASAGHYL